jgi:redox-sensing transcriptional repressor
VREPRRDPSLDKEKLAPKAVVGRVSLYLRQLELFQRHGLVTISSNQLGTSLSLSDAQVRKDLAFFGQFGHPGIGYRIEELIDALRRILGIDRSWPSALVGLGNLGRALIRYRGFRDRGFHLVALFDNDPSKIGEVHDGMIVRPLDSMSDLVQSLHISLAVLAVPAEAAQAVADQVVACGIVGLLNFAPLPLVVPPGVSVVGVDLSVQFEHLAYKVQNSLGGISFLETTPSLEAGPADLH